MNNYLHTGFTLIEIILTLTISSIVGIMLFSYINSSVNKSSQSLLWENENIIIAKTMDKIIADYRNALNSTNINIENIVNNYSSNLDSITVVNTQFDVNGQETGNSSTIFKVVIGKGDHKLMSIFTVKN